MRTVVRLAACVLPVVLACAPSHNTEPAMPDPDLSGMEPPVAKLLGDSRAAVLDAPADGASWGRLGAAFDAHGLSSEAAICYTRAAELDPEEFRWPYLLAIVREVQGTEQSELIERLEAAARLRQDYAPLFVRLGLARFRNGDYESARAALRRTTEIDPRSADAWRGLGQLALALDENEDARKHLERARQLTPWDASIHAALAQALARLGQDEESGRAAERARSLEPREAVRDPLWAREVQALSTSGAFRFSHGVALAKRGKFEEAIDELKLAGEVFPDSYDVHFMLALSYAELGQAEPELEHLRRAVEIAPERLKGRLVLAQSLERLGRAAEALLHYRHALRVSPDSADVQLKVGSALARMQRYAEAVEALHNATTLDPANTDAHRRLGAALELLGRTDESREHYDEATRRAESDRLP